MKLIIIEANISSGKSYLTREMCSALNYKPVFEPVNSNPYLELFYQDQKRWALEMQYWLMSNRFKMHEEAIRHIWKTGQPVVMDRSIYGDAIFAKKNHMDGNISDLGYESYLKHRDVMRRFLMVPHQTVFLRVSPETCKDRIENVRKRNCEKGMPLDYLEGLERYYGELLEELEEMGSSVRFIDNDPFRTTGAIINELGLPKFQNSLEVGVPAFQ